MRKNERKENGRRDTSLKKELVYLLIFALVLGSFGFDWTSVRKAVGIGSNAGADELYIVEAKEFEDEDFLDDEDEFYDDDDDFDFEDEDDFEYDEEYGDEDDFEYEEDYDDDEDFDDDDYDGIDDEDFDDEDDYDDDWDEDDEDDWDDEDDVDDEDADSEDAYDEMPAGTLYQESENGVRVRADFDEDVFPVGVYMELTDISRGEALEAANGAVDNAVDAAGVDISFFDGDGEEIEPEDDGDVRVILSLDTPLARGSGQTVVHINDDGGATELPDEDVIASSYKSVVFTASEFSLYLVVSTKEQEEARITPSTTISASSSTTPSVTKSVVFTAAKAITLAEGGEKSLQVALRLGMEEISAVKWESSDTNIVSITNDTSNPCTITAEEEGTAVISAIVTIGRYEYIAKQSVTVVDVSVGVFLNKTSLTLEAGKSETLIPTVTVTPSMVGDISREVTWSSNDENVTVDANGKVTAGNVSENVTATITVTSKADPDQFASCTVSVVASGSGDSGGDDSGNGGSGSGGSSSGDSGNSGSGSGGSSSGDSGNNNSGSTTVTWTSYQLPASDRRSDKTATIEAVGVSGAEDEDLKLIISDITASDKTKLQSLISSNSLSYSIAPYFFELDLVDENNNKVANDDFGACLVTMKLPSGMSASGDVQAVSIANDGTLDILLSRTGTIGGVSNCVQFRADHFSPFAILYAAKSSGGSSASNSVGASSGGGTVIRYVDDDDDDDDDSDDSTTTDSYAPNIKQVRWWGTDKSTFYWAEKKAVTGYRLQYSTSASFKKAKTTSINSKKKNVTVTGMKMNKKYYVRVRAYTKSSDGKTTWKSWSHRVIVKRKH